jgi:hypothetical protein
MPPDNNKFIYKPSRFNLQYEDVYITTSDNVKLHTWLIKHTINNLKEWESIPTIIYFHGNAGMIF